MDHTRRTVTAYPLFAGFILSFLLFMALPFCTASATGPALKVSGASPAAINANYNDTGSPTGGKATYLSADGGSYFYYDGSKWCLKNQYWDYYYSNSSNSSDASIPPSGGWKNMDGSSAAISVSYGPSISFDETSVSVNEEDGNVSLRVNISSFDYSTTINYSTSDGTALNGSDYNGVVNSPVFINGGTAYIYISVGLIDDTKYEGNETFTVTLSSPSGAPVTSGTCTVTIISGDPQARVGFSSSTQSAAENAGSVILPVTLDAAAESAVTVHYATNDGTALSGSDYTASSGDLTIPAGGTSGSISVPLLNDGTYEGSETFTVALSSPSNAEITTAAITVTITDDENAPVISFDPAGVITSEGTVAVTLTATMSVPCQNAVDAAYATANGSATAGKDYTAKTGTLRFPAGSTAGQVEIALLDDDIYEGEENFSVTFSSASAGSLGTATASITLNDNELMPQLNLDADSLTVDEDGGKAQFTVTLTGKTQYGAACQVTTNDVTAKAGQDYTGKAETFTIPGGSVSGVIEIPITDDNIYEGAGESFTVGLSSPSGATLGESGAAVTITDNDGKPKTGFAAASLTQDENAGTALLTVELDHPSQTEITVDYATADGTALAGSDYTASSGTLTIPALSVSNTIPVPITNDSVYEGSEDFTVTLSSPAGADLQTAAATVTIADDETLPVAGFTPDAVSFAENAGSAALTVTLSCASKTDITIDYATANGTALKDSDYTETSGTITFQAGATTAGIHVPLLDNSVYEAEEAFTVTLSNPQGASLGLKTATATVTDDESVPKLSFAPATLTLDESAGTATLNVTLSGQTQNDVTVQYATQDGTASSGSDFTAKTGTVTIPAGSLTGTVEISLKEDGLYEGGEAFAVVLSSPTGAAIQTGTATVQIGDNESMPQVSFDPAAVSESEDAATAELTVKLSGPSQAIVTVQYATQDGTASAGQDYDAAAGILTIPGGETSGTAEITLADDTVYEGPESFAVLLTNPQGATLGVSNATVQLTDNDPAPVIGFDPASASFAENAGQAALTVTLSGISQADTTVQYATQNGTAAGGDDFTQTAGTVTILAGSTSATVDIPITDDMLYEGDEAFTVLLASPHGAVLGEDTATVTVTDTETKPEIGFNPLTASFEQDESAGKIAADVILSGASQADISVDFTTVSGTAKPDADYTGVSGTLIIPGGSTSGRIEISLKDDSIFEGDETFTVKLSSPSGATLGSDTALLTIKDDEGYPQAGFAQSTFDTAEDGGKARLTVNLTCASREDIGIEYATNDGTATAGKDYAAKDGILTIPAGSTSGTIEISLKEDAIYEGGETFTVTLSIPSGTGATLGLDSATVQIGDNESMPVASFDPADLTFKENAGTAALAVKLSGVSKTDTAIQFTTLDGTARSGGDYTFNAGTLTIKAGSATGTLEITLLDDSVYEAGEDFSVVLSGPAGAAIGTGTAAVHITDNDSAPQIGFEAPSVHVSEAQAQLGITVRLSEVSGTDTSVAYSTADDSAMAGYDYIEQTGTLVIPAGSLTGTISVPLMQDEVYEESEAFTIQLNSPSGAALFTDTVSVVLDDSLAVPALSIAPATVRESAGEAALTVSLSHLSSKDITVAYATGDKTAKAGSDYRSASGTLVIPAMTLTGAVNVRILNDAVYESTETLKVTLSSPAGATIGTDQALITITDNDPKPSAAPTASPAPAPTATTAREQASATPVAAPTPTPAPVSAPTPTLAPVTTIDPGTLYVDVQEDAMAIKEKTDEGNGQQETATVVYVDEDLFERTVAHAREVAQDTGADVIVRFPDIVPAEEDTAMRLSLLSSQVQSVVSEGMGVSVKMENVTFAVPSGVLSQAAEDTDNISLECRKAQDEAQPYFKIDGGNGALIGQAYQYALAVTRKNGDTGYVDQFNTPVTITIQLTPEEAAAITDISKVAMRYVNPVTGRTELLPSVYDQATMTLTFNTTYFAEAAED